MQLGKRIVTAGRGVVLRPGRIGGGPSAAKVAGGRKAAAHGRMMQALVVLLAHRQNVQLEELPPSGAQFHGPGQAHCLPMPCDFVGCFVPSGRALFFDAKRIDEGNAFPLNKEEIAKPHQVRFLHRMAQAGAVAGILVQHGGAFHWLPGTVLLPVRRVPWEDPAWIHLGERMELARLL